MRTPPLRVVPVIACSLVGGLMAWPALASSPKPAPAPPAKETLKYGENEVVVERASHATAEDLQVPFYPGAKVREGRTYRTSTKDGKPLNFYAVAVLVSRDTPEKIAKTYSSALPGNPKPETVKDKAGTRLVLSVGSKEEVRSVSITKTRTGSEIRLTRTLKHTQTLSLPEPEVAKPMEPGDRMPGRRGPGFRGPGRRGPGMRRGPGRGGQSV